MDRNESPDYSAPRDGWFSPSRRSPVPTASWSRGRSPGEDRSRRGDWSSRSRKRSPRRPDAEPQGGCICTIMDEELEKSRKMRGDMIDEEGGYRTVPQEMKLFRDDEREELERLRKENSNLKRKVQVLEDKEKCKKEHHHQEMEELRSVVRHQRKKIMDLRTSQMNHIKRETIVKPEVKSEMRVKTERCDYFEYKEEEEDDF